MVELPEKIVLCAISELPDPGSKGINVSSSEKLQEVFVVRVGNEVYGYQNHCPHTGVNLDWLPDQFLDMRHPWRDIQNRGWLLPAWSMCRRKPAEIASEG